LAVRSSLRVIFVLSMETIKKEPVVVYAESTPNPAAMKLVANRILLENSLPLEFFGSAEAKSSPLAIELFKFPFVKSVFISANYITVFKTDKIEWDDIIFELREFLREYLSSGRTVISSASPSVAGSQHSEEVKNENFSVEHAIPQTEIEKKIVAVLEQYVAPAVEQDGGMIVFHSYKDGTVSLVMRGACSGCPSSTVTLKAGIEAILKKFIPEVKEVISANG
jgi:Fe-S cluster biogenesis protein NfuA